MNKNYCNQVVSNDDYYIWQDYELLDLQMEEAEALLAAEMSDFELELDFA